MKSQDRFISRLLHNTAPLLIWIGHFFFCYLYLAIEGGGAGACGTSMPVVAAVSLPALAGLVWIIHGAARRVYAQPGLTPLSDWTRLGIAVLSLTAVVWTCVPLLVLCP